MRLPEGHLRLAFRAVVTRVAIADDEVARARWWKWVLEATPAPRETNPGRLVASLEDIVRSRGTTGLEVSA